MGGQWAFNTFTPSTCALFLCVAGVCGRGHLGSVPGGEGSLAAAGPGGETQDPDVGAGDPQPPRDAGGDVRLSGSSLPPTCTVSNKHANRGEPREALVRRPALHPARQPGGRLLTKSLSILCK